MRSNSPNRLVSGGQKNRSTQMHQVSLIRGIGSKRERGGGEKVSGQKWKFTERSEIHGRMKNEERTREHGGST